MNYRLVFKVYSDTRRMTDEELALLSTLRGMSEADQQLMIETLSPQSKSAKKPGKKSATKSRKASSLANQIQQRPRVATTTPLCVFVVNSETGETCNARDDDTIHDPSYLSSHLFVHADQETQASGASGGD